ncbi:hypothetical protein LEP1GSC008_0794 [Leptospira kirschneri serovar Bulgarica str. Nikolaevo]|uniref:Uncharacterized protein n=1 Tax=Leptospira kirschneri serovar Bulgarica str. Nikolaevo TaxID=1240687 RepID=M6FM86_9LEPT|nr:hypothetical protein LEP1GSC008_0794 [Leptospira kirschneri serovar Bulgarica str. Nikolaevo]
MTEDAQDAFFVSIHSPFKEEKEQILHFRETKEVHVSIHSPFKEEKEHIT